MWNDHWDQKQPAVATEGHSVEKASVMIWCREIVLMLDVHLHKSLVLSAG
jgi:hypothetical protein